MTGASCLYSGKQNPFLLYNYKTLVCVNALLQEIVQLYSENWNWEEHSVTCVGFSTHFILIIIITVKRLHRTSGGGWVLFGNLTGVAEQWTLTSNRKTNKNNTAALQVNNTSVPECRFKHKWTHTHVIFTHTVNMWTSSIINHTKSRGIPST